MKYLKNYKSYLESNQFGIDINESLGMFYDNILKSVGSEEVNMYDTFKIDEERFSDMDLSELSDNVDFINSLTKINLKKSNLENTEDFETFINKPCRFMMIYDIEANELENPQYLLIESWNDAIKKWQEPKLYKINGDIKLFYDKISSKVIEIEHNGNNYIYQSSNKNEWILQNKSEDDMFKSYFRKDELEEFIKSNNLSINVK